MGLKLIFFTKGALDDIGTIQQQKSYKWFYEIKIPSLVLIAGKFGHRFQSIWAITYSCNGFTSIIR